MTYLRKMMFWVWQVLSSAVDLLHPGYLTADPTPRRVQKFYDLMHEVHGGDEADVMAAPVPQGPVDTSQVAAAAKRKSEEKERVAEKVQEIRNAFMREDRLSELADVVLDLPFYADPGDVPMGIVTEATGVFIVGYSVQIIRLTGTRHDTE